MKKKKYLVFMFLVMTFCATPHMIFFYSGSRTPDEKVDSLQLVRFTAGNMGFNIETVNKSSCVDCNGTMIEVFGKTVIVYYVVHQEEK